MSVQVRNGPLVTVEMALISHPLDASPTWTDVSDGLRSGQTKRGRSHELDRMQAGIMTLAFRNADDRWNRWNTAGEFYGNLLDAQQASLEDAGLGTTGWVAQAGVTISRSTALFDDGIASLQMQCAAGGDATARTTEGTGGKPVLPGFPYWAMASFAAPVTARNCDVSIVWYNSGGTLISVSTGATVSDSGWTIATVTAKAPSTAAFAAVQVRAKSTAAAELHNVDKICFNGGDPTTSPFGYTWTPGGLGGLLQPMVKIRLKAVWSAVTYYLFTGYVESITHAWPNKNYSETTITAVDGFKILSLAKAARTTFKDAVLADTPVAYYRLNESGVADAVNGLITAVDSSGNGYDGIYHGSPTFNQRPPMPSEIGNASIDLGAARTADGGRVDLPNAACPSGTGDFTIETWAFPRSFQQGTPKDRIWDVYNIGTQILSCSILSDGTLNFAALAGAPASGGTLESTTALDINRWNHVVLVKSGITGPASWKIYINGADVSGTATIGAGGGNVSLTADSGMIGGYEVSGVEQGAFDGFVSEFAVYTSALSAGDVAAHYDAAYGLANTALTGDRIGSLLDVAGIPSADRDLDAGQFVMQPVNEPLWDNSSLPLILDYVDSEGHPATFYFAGDGDAVFQDRAHAIPSSLITFGDYVGAGYVNPHNGSGGDPPVVDDLNLWTTVVGQAVNGVAQVATDAAAAARYANRTLSRTNLRNNDDADVATLVAALLSRFKTPSDRVKDIVVHPPGNPAGLYPYALGLELNDRFGYIRYTFPGNGDYLFLDLRAEGITHDFGPADWRTSIMGAPL